MICENKICRALNSLYPCRTAADHLLALRFHRLTTATGCLRRCRRVGRNDLDHLDNSQKLNDKLTPPNHTYLPLAIADLRGPL